MAKRYEMTMADYESLNRKAIPFNIIIMVIAAVCTVMLFVSNFWKFTVKYEINKSVLNDVIGAIDIENENGVFDNLDYSVIEGLSIKASLSINSDILLVSITGGGKETAKKMISSTITDLTGQVGDIMADVLKASVKLFASAALEDVKEQLKAELPENFIDDINLEGLDNIIDMFFSPEGINRDALNGEIIALLGNIADQAGLTENDKQVFINDAMEMVDPSIDSMIDTLGTDSGNGKKVISAEQLMANLLGEALGVDYKNMSFDDIANNIAASLVEEMPQTAIDIIHYSILGLAILLIITAAAWGLLFLFAFIRLFTKKKTLYLGLARGFGCLPYCLLVITPWVGMLIIKAVIGDVPGLGGLSIGFSSVGLLISFIGAVVLALLKWFGYGKIKKKVKRAVIINEDYNRFSQENRDEFSDEKFNISKSEDVYSDSNSDENFW